MIAGFVSLILLVIVLSAPFQMDTPLFCNSLTTLPALTSFSPRVSAQHFFTKIQLDPATRSKLLNVSNEILLAHARPFGSLYYADITYNLTLTGAELDFLFLRMTARAVIAEVYHTETFQISFKYSKASSKDEVDSWVHGNKYLPSRVIGDALAAAKNSELVASFQRRFPQVRETVTFLDSVEVVNRKRIWPLEYGFLPEGQVIVVSWEVVEPGIEERPIIILFMEPYSYKTLGVKSYWC